jgi:hypothetical protein
MSLLEHAKRELKLAGYDISDKGCDMHDDKESFEGYVNSCARSAYELIETLSKAHHSGMSVGITLGIFNKLAKWETLMPLTNNPDEWKSLCERESASYQNKRNPACFTKDFKTYYNVEADENYDIVKENGISTKKLKDKSWVEHPLKDYKK